jgi:hypothetical protein
MAHRQHVLTPPFDQPDKNSICFGFCRRIPGMVEAAAASLGEAARSRALLRTAFVRLEHAIG